MIEKNFETGRDRLVMPGLVWKRGDEPGCTAVFPDARMTIESFENEDVGRGFSLKLWALETDWSFRIYFASEYLAPLLSKDKWAIAGWETETREPVYLEYERFNEGIRFDFGGLQPVESWVRFSCDHSDSTVFREFLRSEMDR